MRFAAMSAGTSGASPDRGGRFDIDDDRVVDIDQIVGGVSRRRPVSPWAPVQRAAGSTGEMNFGVTSVAAPNVRSVVEHGQIPLGWRVPRPPAEVLSSPSIPFCRFASALIRLGIDRKAFAAEFRLFFDAATQDRLKQPS